MTQATKLNNRSIHGLTVTTFLQCHFNNREKNISDTIFKMDASMMSLPARTIFIALCRLVFIKAAEMSVLSADE